MTDNTTLTDAVLTHAAKIKGAWQKAVSSIIETGQLLIEAKKALSHGEFLKLFDPEIGNLPFGKNTGQQLMRVARNPVLSKADHGQLLPPSWRTLATLSRAPPKLLEQWLADGNINSETKRAEAEDLITQLHSSFVPKVLRPSPPSPSFGLPVRLHLRGLPMDYNEEWANRFLYNRANEACSCAGRAEQKFDEARLKAGLRLDKDVIDTVQHAAQAWQDLLERVLAAAEETEGSVTRRTPHDEKQHPRPSL
jgi:uncharacterized protein (DUF4415 family)